MAALWRQPELLTHKPDRELFIRDAARYSLGTLVLAVSIPAQLLFSV